MAKDQMQEMVILCYCVVCGRAMTGEHGSRRDDLPPVRHRLDGSPYCELCFGLPPRGYGRSDGVMV